MIALSTNYLIAIAILVVILIVIIYFVYFRGESSASSYDNDVLAKKLQKCGWKLIAKDGCHFCEEQQKILKYPHISITDVSTDVKNMVVGVPFWINSNKEENNVMIGLQSREQLIKAAECNKS